MLKKRLVATVTIRQQLAVQSAGYSRYLPLGKPECVIKNLDRWGADEIFIQEIDRSKADKGPNLALIEKIAEKHIATPLAYAGGIRNAQDAIAVVKSGVERVCIESLLHSDPKAVYAIADALGTQAILASFALMKVNQTIYWMNYLTREKQQLTAPVRELIKQGIVSEIIVIDSQHEGIEKSFDNSLTQFFAEFDIPLILFGGLSEPEQLNSSLAMDNVIAVAIGNFLNYKEHRFQTIKNMLNNSLIRPPQYKVENRGHSFL